MTISLEITKVVSIGQNPKPNVTVINLCASSAEIPFVSALTSSIVEFTEKYGKSAEGQKGGAK